MFTKIGSTGSLSASTCSEVFFSFLLFVYLYLNFKLYFKCKYKKEL